MFKNLLTFFLGVCVVFHLQGQTQTQFENPGFEEWEDVDLPVQEPVDWSSIKTGDVANLNIAAPIVWGKSTDAHSGNYSINVFNVFVPLINQAAVGTISNGRYHQSLNHDLSWTYLDTADARWSTPLNARPDSVVGWFKCFPEPGDHGQVKVTLHKGYGQHPEDESGHIGVALFNMPGDTVNVWTRFSVPFIYDSEEMPDNILCVLMSGNGWDALGSSSAFYDDLLLIYNSSDISDFNPENFKIYSSQGEIVLGLNTNENVKYKVNIVDLTGRIVYSNEFSGGETMRFNPGLTPGIYIVNAISGEKIISRKVVIN